MSDPNGLVMGDLVCFLRRKNYAFAVRRQTGRRRFVTLLNKLVNIGMIVSVPKRTGPVVAASFGLWSQIDE